MALLHLVCTSFVIDSACAGSAEPLSPSRRMMSPERCYSLAQEPGTGGPGHLAFWLSTIDADGRPHMTAVGDFWVDGRYYLGRAVSTPARRRHWMTS